MTKKTFRRGRRGFWLCTGPNVRGQANRCWYIFQSERAAAVAAWILRRFDSSADVFNPQWDGF